MDTKNRIWSTLRKKPMAIIGMAMLAVALIMAFFAPLLAPYDPSERVDAMPTDILAPPGTVSTGGGTLRQGRAQPVDLWCASLVDRWFCIILFFNVHWDDCGSGGRILWRTSE